MKITFLLVSYYGHYANCFIGSTFHLILMTTLWLFFTLQVRICQMALAVKNQPANGGRHKRHDSIPRSRRSPGGGHGNPLQYPCLENPMDRGAWRATVHGVTESQTRLSMHTSHHRNSNTGKFFMGTVGGYFSLTWGRRKFSYAMYRKPANQYEILVNLAS